MRFTSSRLILLVVGTCCFSSVALAQANVIRVPEDYPTIRDGFRLAVEPWPGGRGISPEL